MTVVTELVHYAQQSIMIIHLLLSPQPTRIAQNNFHTQSQGLHITKPKSYKLGNKSKGFTKLPNKHAQLVQQVKMKGIFIIS